MPTASLTVPGVGIQESYPLTPLQQGLLVQALRAPGSGIDIEQVVCRLREAVDGDRLERAWARVVQRQGILRTRFRWADVPEPVQEVLPRAAVPMERTDLSALPSAEAERRLEEWLEADRGRGFDLGEAPAMRLALFGRGDGEHVMVWCFHHILLDGRSVTRVLREVFTFYDAAEMDEAEASLETPRPFRDHVAWLRGRDPAADRAFWSAQFRGIDTPEPVRALRAAPRDPAREAPFGTRELRLAEADTAALRAFESEQGVWLNTLVQGAWALLLGRCTASPEVVFGVVRGGRAADADGAEGTVGLLINTVPVRAAVQTDASVLDWVDGIAEQGAALVPHEHAALDDVARWSGLPQGSVLFDTLLDFQPQSFDAPLRALGGSWEARSLGIRRRPGLPLSLSVAGERRLRLRMDYDADRFDAAAVDAMLSRFAVLLQALAAAPELPVSRVSMLLPDEREGLLAAGRATRGFAVEERIHERFERRAAERPEAPAVTFGGTTLSYGKLNARANGLAHRLRALGVGPETRVGIALERSAELVVATLAVLKAGGGYVPVDPAYPVDRIAFVLEDSEAPVLVTTDDLRARLASFNGATLCVDADAGTIGEESGENPRVDAGPDSLAYVIYTSGSTGKPKGVQVTHANVVRLLDATDSWFGFGAEDVWTLFHSAAFDFSVWEIWGALLYGGRLVVVPYLTTRSPEDFHRLLVEEGVTVLNQTPSAFRQLVQADLASGVPVDALRLRYVVFGGEALDPHVLRPWMDRHGDERPRLVNMYGITETTVHVTWREIARADLERGGSPIGIPIPDLSLHLLDRALEPVPAGVPGELYVGGAGVARGYLNRPELTAERFVRDPFSDDADARLYRSGDLARRRADGELEYLGRADQQVKVRGFRIETAEIEAALASHPVVADAAVVVREEDGEKRLVAYVVPPAGVSAPAPAELRAHVSALLPDYMVPTAFVVLDALPLTENGKLDRRALPAPDDAYAAAAEYTAPRTPAEAVLAEVWREVLGVERVGIDDNYFALGGDSIRSVRVVAAARRAGVSVSIAQLFRHPTVRGLAAAVVGEEPAVDGPAGRDSGAEPFALLDPAARHGLPDDVEDAYPVSQVQLAMLYHTERDPASLVYFEIMSYRVHTRWDETAMREALRRVAARHPLLRTSFDLSAHPEPVQRVHRAAGIPLEVSDLRQLDAAEQDAWIDREKGRGFDWTRPPLVRFHVHLLSPEVFRLVLVEHHVVLDGWSVAALLTELLRLYAALRDGTPDPTGAPPAARFRDFVELERQSILSAASRGFWRGVVDGAPAAALPPREGGNTPRPDDAPWLRVDVPAGVAAGLREVAAAAGVPLKTVLLAAHLRVLALLGGADEVVTGYVTSGRPEAQDGERVLGVFLNIVPLRLRMAGATWLELVRRAYAAEDALLPHRRFPLAEIVREAGGHTPFEAAFNFTHFHVYGALEAGGVRLEAERLFEKTEVPLLASAIVIPATGALRLRLEYDPARLGEAQVHAIGGWYARALEALAARPGARWDADTLLDAAEEARLRRLAAGPAPEHERCGVHELFQRQVERAPDAVAVVCGEDRLTYRALNQRANRLAHHLA
ncbi:MAG TPA: amino acid adenylation domain-containing protein, partial [Longimicrobium sp.]|nr:amino acid adenylation domain-containing protein [Longimicrobium sp.]